MSSSFITQIGSDINGEAASDYSGYSVSLSSDGSVVAIGAPYNDGNGTDSGHVRIYKNVNNIWTQVGADIDGEAAGDYSGWNSISLSSDGSIVAIGAYGNDGNGNYSGHVRIYQNVNNIWTQVGADIDGEAADDYSGWNSISLSSDGSIVAIGAVGNDGNGTDSGHVRIYQNVNNIWTQVGADIDGRAAGDRSGTSFSLSSDGSVVAIGADSDWNHGNGNDSGHVRIYKNVNNTWTQVGSDIDGEASGDQSGYSVSLSSDGSVVAIGAPDNDGNGDLSGHVRVYQNVNNTWTQVGSDIDGEAASDYSGWSVSLSSDGSVVAIGAPYNDGNGNDSGHVRIYKNFNNTWAQIGSDINGDYAEDDRSGLSFSLSSDGSVIAIGAPGNDGNGADSGHVRVYQVDTTTPTLSDLEAYNYIASNNDLISAFGIDIEAAKSHYINYGYAEGRATDNFNAWGYLAKYDDLVNAFGSDVNSAIQHYINHGFSEGRSSGDFEVFNYLASHNDLINAFGSNSDLGGAHYLNHGKSEGRALDTFDEWSYIASHTDLIAAFGSYSEVASLGTQHYINHGYSEGRVKDDFDEWGYLASNTDLMGVFGSDTTEAIKHFISYGNSEGRSTNIFNAESYLNNYADLKNAFGNDHTLATKHYVENGFNEGRLF